MLLLSLLVGCVPTLLDGTYDTQLESLDGERVEEVDGSEDADFIDANTVEIYDCGLGVTVNWNEVEITADGEDTYVVDTVAKDDDFELVVDGAEVTGEQDVDTVQVGDCTFDMAPVLEGEILSSDQLELSREQFLTEVSGDCNWLELPCSWVEDWLLVRQ